MPKMAFVFQLSNLVATKRKSLGRTAPGSRKFELLPWGLGAPPPENGGNQTRQAQRQHTV